VSDASRKNLIKIVKGSLSLEEIKQKVNEARNPLKTKTKRDKAFIMAGVAQAFLVIYGIATYVIFFVSVYAAVVYPYQLSYIQSNAILGLVAAAFFLIFTVLNLSSMIALRQRLSGNRSGMISGSIGLVSSIFGLIYYIATFLGLTYQTVEISPGNFQAIITLLGNLLPVIYTALITSTMILIGVFFLLNRRRLSDSELSMATGIIYIFAGSSGVSLPSYFSYYYATFAEPTLFIIAGALGLACFLARKLAE
jgi:hypothetical protein